MTFRPERFVLSEPMACELSEQCLHVAAIEVRADGTAILVIEPDELDESEEPTEPDVDRAARAARSPKPEARSLLYGGCAAMGVGGYHSADFGEESGRCEWCGLDSPRQPRKVSP